MEKVGSKSWPARRHNTPRSKLRNIVFDNTTPDLFELWLKNPTSKVQHKSIQEPIVFLKVWNDWAEGNYLEPDRETRGAYLDAIRRVVVPAMTIDLEG